MRFGSARGFGCGVDEDPLRQSQYRDLQPRRLQFASLRLPGIDGLRWGKFRQRLFGPFDESVDHGAGNLVDRRCGQRVEQPVRDLVRQHEVDPAALVAQRRERPVAVEMLERPLDQAHLEPQRPALRVARLETEAKLQVGEIKARGNPLVAALEDRRTSAPGQELWVRLRLLDQVEHVFGRVRHEHRTPDFHTTLQPLRPRKV